jgi:hypothetical protein
MSVLIWCPVKDEARHIEETLQSILGQTYRNFRLVVSDNHSSDGTDGIVETYAGVDERITLVRPPEPMPGIAHAWWLWDYVRNNYSASAAMHIGGHDLVDRQYLARLSAVLAGSQSIVCTYAKTSLQIDDIGRVIGRWGSGPQTVGIEQPWKWLSMLTQVQHNHLAFGLVRWEAFKTLELQEPCSAADHFVNAELTFLGDFYEVEGPVLALRRSPGHGDHDVYRKKHFDGLKPAEDFRRQLRWLTSLVERSCRATEPGTTDIVLAMATLSFMVRYASMLDAMGLLANGTLDAEFPEVAALLDGNVNAGRRLQGVLV